MLSQSSKTEKDDLSQSPPPPDYVVYRFDCQGRAAFYFKYAANGAEKAVISGDPLPLYKIFQLAGLVRDDVSVASKGLKLHEYDARTSVGGKLKESLL